MDIINSNICGGGNKGIRLHGRNCICFPKYYKYNHSLLLQANQFILIQINNYYSNRVRILGFNFTSDKVVKMNADGTARSASLSLGGLINGASDIIGLKNAILNATFREE